MSVPGKAQNREFNTNVGKQGLGATRTIAGVAIDNSVLTDAVACTRVAVGASGVDLKTGAASCALGAVVALKAAVSIAKVN